MKVPIIFRRSALSVCLISVLLTPTSALAALSGSDSSKLDQYEKTVFGNTRPQLSEESRLRALEINLFGKSKNGGHDSRLNSIAKVMGAPSTAKFLPPMAGSMDTSALAPKSPAPRYSQPQAGSRDLDSDSSADLTASEPAPVAPSSHDRSKDLLRQALEKHSQGDTNGAERLFKQALAIDPGNADANFNLGAMLEDKGDMNGALHYYQVAANSSPSDKDVQDALTAVREKIHQSQVAQQTQADMQKKVQLKQVADQAAAAYKAGNYDQAISALDRIASQTPNDPNVQYGLGQAWRGKGDLNKARQYISRASAISPDNQLYRTTLSDLDRDAQRQIARGSNSSAGNRNEPSAAPDYSASRGSGNNSRGAQGGDVQGFDNSDIASSGGSGDMYNSGGVQPFSDQGEGRLYGHEMANGVRSSFGGGGMGGLGLGALGALSGLGINRMGGGARYGGSGNRLMRGAVAGALSGAALGALTNMHGPGGIKSGAMRGAMTGGLFGLMTGF
jgi:tetratricopeptide (TPR) repeat protein